MSIFFLGFLTAEYWINMTSSLPFNIPESLNTENCTLYYIILWGVINAYNHINANTYNTYHFLIEDILTFYQFIHFLTYFFSGIYMTKQIQLCKVNLYKMKLEVYTISQVDLYIIH